MVNIIPFNPWEGSPFESSSKTQIQKFADFLEREGIRLFLELFLFKIFIY